MSKQCNRSTRSRRLGRAGLIALGVLAASASTAGAAGAKQFYVSAKHGNNANPCTASAPCKTIQHAVASAHPGDTVFVEKGLYSQFVSITKRLTLVGQGQPVDDLHGRSSGFAIDGPKTAGTVITGFTIKHSTFEGIIVVHTAHITITKNVIENNDLGVFAKQPSW